MSRTAVHTSLMLPYDRAVPPAMCTQIAQAYEATGVVDSAIIADNLTAWLPRVLWRPEITPAAAMTDGSSFADAFLIAGVSASATQNLGVAVTTDPIRRNPAELVQTMLTLADLTEGRATVMVGAGENMRLRNFGYKRAGGLGKLEDLFRIFRTLWEADGPADYDGNTWKLSQAWIGGHRPHRPKFWAMGGGPKLVDIATRYADGLVCVVPGVYSTPERFAAYVQRIKQQVERHGRDPEAFDFGVWLIAALHEDDAALERTFANELVRFYAAFAGRINQHDWKDEGLDPVFLPPDYPEDWHYAKDLFPLTISDQEVKSILDHTPPEMAAKSTLYGSAGQVAKQFSAFVEAGATHVAVADFVPLVFPHEAPQSMGRQIEFCRQLKGL